MPLPILLILCYSFIVFNSFYFAKERIVGVPIQDHRDPERAKSETRDSVRQFNNARVAQWIERRRPKAGVAGPIPATGTT